MTSKTNKVSEFLHGLGNVLLAIAALAILSPFLIGAFLLLAAMFSSEAEGAEQSVFAAFSLVDDGSCERALPMVELGYSRSGDDHDVRGSVRTGPAGGDCRQDSTSYDLSAEQRFDFGLGGLDGLVKFQAAENSLSAPYAIADGAGNVIPRPDGGAANPVMLPAGRSKTVLGILGASMTSGAWNFDAGLNFAPVDWADGSTSETLHLAATGRYEVGGGNIELAGHVDAGSGEHFGGLSLSWDRLISGNWTFGRRISPRLGPEFPGLRRADRRRFRRPSGGQSRRSERQRGKTFPAIRLVFLMDYFAGTRYETDPPSREESAYLKSALSTGRKLVREIGKSTGSVESRTKAFAELEYAMKNLHRRLKGLP